MDTPSPESVQRQIRQRVAQEQERLAQKARDLLQALSQEQQPGSDRSQMQHLLAAALEAQGPTTLKAWIAYQAARHAKWWKPAFTRRLEQALDELAQDGQRIAREIPGASAQQVSMELIRLFVGYLSWWHRALASEKEAARQQDTGSRAAHRPAREGG